MQGDVILNNYSQFCGFELVLVEILTDKVDSHDINTLSSIRENV
jgi:hypothetical protein